MKEKYFSPKPVLLMAVLLLATVGEFINQLLDAIYAQVGDAGVLAIVAVLLGWVGKPLVQFLKDRFGLEDKKALTLALITSVVLAVLHAAILGVLRWGAIDADTIVAAFGLIFTTATVLYRWFRTGEAPPE